MSKIMLVTHHDRKDAIDLTVATIRRLRDEGHDAWLPTEDAAKLGLYGLDGAHRASDADLVVCLGGDGTMLRAVHLLGGASVPLLGVNKGRLGYLTEIEADALDESLRRFEMGSDAGQWHLDERMMLDVELFDADGVARGRHRALNEMVAEKSVAGHTAQLLVRIDGEPFTTYSADGLIVSTPTGSTAYSLSARGPVVSPKHRALLVTPVAPHMLFDRSLVLDPGEAVEIEVVGTRSAVVAIDGRAEATLPTGGSVRCTRSDSVARFVRFGAHHYHQVLKAKFGLRDHPVSP